jgi:hypothetical protein
MYAHPVETGEFFKSSITSRLVTKRQTLCFCSKNQYCNNTAISVQYQTIPKNYWRKTKREVFFIEKMEKL